MDYQFSHFTGVELGFLGIQIRRRLFVDYQFSQCTSQELGSHFFDFSDQEKIFVDYQFSHFTGVGLRFSLNSVIRRKIFVDSVLSVYFA